MSNIQLNSIENFNNPNSNNNNNNNNNLKITSENNSNNYLSDKNFISLTCLSSSTSTSTTFCTTNSSLSTSSIITATTTTTTSTSTIINITTSSAHDTYNDKIQAKEISCIQSENLLKSETREIDTITDICCSDNIAEVDIFSLINDNLPLYKLRADTLFTHNNSDWIQAPLYIDEQQIGELTTEQIKHTLDYFILSGFRVSQMTKTYYDIDAVNKLLEEKEKDLELAATIGKHLLDKGQVLETKIEILEEQLDKATEMVNQLRHEITLKDDLLQNFIDSEEDLNNSNGCHNRNANQLNISNENDGHNVELLRKRISRLENENYMLKNDADCLKEETNDFEKQEQLLVENCVKELMTANSKLETIEEELKVKTKECSHQQDEISNLFNNIIELQMKIKSLTIENAELKSLINISASTQNELAIELMDIKTKYNDCLNMLHTTQEDLRVIRRKYTKKTEIRSLKQQRQCLYAPWMTANSFAAELHFSAQNQEQAMHDYKQKRDSFDLVRKVREKLIKTMPGSNVDSCFPSDSEYESMITSSSSLNLTSNTTMVNLNNNALIIEANNFGNRCDSHLSNYSGSYLSSNIGSNMRSYLPDKLQIVKPIEGSQTLQHWQQLATPNLGCLIEPRPGIYIKGKDPNVDSNSSTCSSVSTTDVDHNINIATIRDINKRTYDDEITSDLDETFNISYIEDDDANDYYQALKTSDTASTFTYVDANNSSNNETKTVFTLPTIVSSDTLTDLNNINLNERILLKKLLNSQEENFNIQTNAPITNTTNTISTMTSSTSTTTTTTTSSATTMTTYTNPYLDEIKNLSQKYFQTPLASDNLKISSNKFKIKSLDLHNKLNDLNLLNNLQNGLGNNNNTNQSVAIIAPDTPPPSPTMELLAIDDNDNEIENINNNNNTETTCKYIATPPTSPIMFVDTNENNQNKIKLLESNFVNEIIERLSIFSFKSIESGNTNNNTATTPTAAVPSSSSVFSSFIPATSTNKQQFSKIVKPLALYANNSDTLITPMPTPTTPNIANPIAVPQFPTVEEEEAAIIEQPINEQKTTEQNTEQIKTTKRAGVPDTPPPSPTLRLSPTPSIPVNDELLSKIDEKKFQNSAFMKVSTMNPLINKSIDLAKLLGSLTTLKRNQRFN